MIWIESIFQDVRHGLRTMRRTPLVSAVAILSLALGIGANTAIFSVLDALLLRPLPVKNASEIELLSWLPKNSTNRAEADVSFSYPTFERFRQSTAASRVAGFSFIDYYSVVAGGRAEFARGEAVSGNYHAVLGVTPVMGRAFTDDDDRETAAPVCVISDRFWQNRFARDPGVIGKRILLASVPVPVVGVEPKEFLGLTPGYGADFKIPFHLIQQIAPSFDTKSIFIDPETWWVKIAARIPQANAAQAQAEINLRFQQSLVADQRGRFVIFRPGGEGLDFISRQFRSPLIVLMTAVGLILLIACANLANLLLARAQAREKETSVRLALGAGAGRLIRQFLTESLLLAASGGALGVMLAYRAGDILIHGFNDSLVFDVRTDIRVLAFTSGITLFTGILFGLAPAMRAARIDIRQGFQREARSSKFGLSSILVVAQLALSLVAVVGAGLYVRTLHNLRVIDLGMATNNVTVFKIVPGVSGYTNQGSAEFAQRVLDRLQVIPGSQSVALSDAPPLHGPPNVTIEVPGAAPPIDPNLPMVGMNLVTAKYFETLGIPVLLGRGIEERDRVGAPLIAVINETFARAYFPHKSPIGRQFRAGTKNYEIVGVVRDSKYDIRRSVAPSFLASFAQSPDFRRFNVELRAAGNPSAVARDVRRALAEIDPNVPPCGLSSMDQSIDLLLRRDRLFAGLSSTFGALALLLAAIGLYGVRAYAVARRTSEIGIRMALGANRAEIKRMILRETGWLALFGVVIGLASAYGLTRYVESMLYGVAPRDLTTFAGAAVVLVAVAATAGYLPARRASKVDPMIALRHD